MLRLNSSPHRYNPNRAPSSGPGLEFSPVPVENDELLQAIDKQPEVWSLDTRPDSNSLTEFWTEVQNDLHNDPNWNTFATDED